MSIVWRLDFWNCQTLQWTLEQVANWVAQDPIRLLASKSFQNILECKENECTVVLQMQRKLPLDVASRTLSVSMVECYSHVFAIKLGWIVLIVIHTVLQYVNGDISDLTRQYAAFGNLNDQNLGVQVHLQVCKYRKNSAWTSRLCILPEVHQEAAATKPDPSWMKTMDHDNGVMAES